MQAIYNLTDGNPFFCEEIFTSLIAAGDIYFTEGGWQRKPLSQIDIPGSVQRSIEQRLSQLGQPAGHLLNLAAVSGRSFDFAVLQALTGNNDRELLALVKELLGILSDPEQLMAVIRGELEAIRSALEATDHHRERAARMLGMSRTTLWRKMKQYRL